eukprot:1160066-Pelagomonas_calceolata.AAC.1
MQRPTFTSHPPSGPRIEPDAEKRQKTLFDMGFTKQSARRARPGHRLRGPAQRVHEQASGWCHCCKVCSPSPLQAAVEGEAGQRERP